MSRADLQVRDLDGTAGFDADVERLVDAAVAQGFPRTVEDPAAIARIAAVLRESPPAAAVASRKKRARGAETHSSSQGGRRHDHADVQSL